MKIAAVMYLGGQCKNCSYNKNITALEFHHVGGDKDFSLSSSTHNKKWETIKAELDKCVLLCANCHREEHFENEGHSILAPDLMGVGVNKEIVDLVEEFIKRTINAPVAQLVEQAVDNR